MMEATDMSKSKPMAPPPVRSTFKFEGGGRVVDTAPKPKTDPIPDGEKPKRGRPPVLTPDQTEKVMYRSSESEYRELVALAAELGYLHRGEGTAGPLLLKIVLLYLTSPNIRQVVDTSRTVPPPPPRGKSATLEYRNWLRCTVKEREAIEEEALRQGNVRDGKGNPGPFIRKLITRYLHDSSVRLAIDGALQHPGAS